MSVTGWSTPAAAYLNEREGGAAIAALDTGVPGGPDQDAVDFRSFGLTIPE